MSIRSASGATRTVLICASFLVIAWSSGPSAQDRRLLDANGYVRDDAYPRPLVPAADQKYLKIDGLKMKEVMKEVVAISLKSRDDGNKYWGRIAGSKYEAMVHDWAEAKFKKYGLQDVHRQPFKMSTQWFPIDWDYTFTAGGKSYTFKSVNPSLHSPATPPGGLDLDVVWVGTGTAADFAGRDVKGKAVLIHSIPAPGSMGHSAAYERAMARAAEKGAAAIGVVYGISDNFAIWQGLWLLAALAIAVRMILATLDGFVAERYGKATRLGSYLNRAVTEISDALVLLGIFPHANPFWVAAMIAAAWVVNVAGVLGPSAGGGIQWTGPAGQADRLAILAVTSLVATVTALDWTVVCALIVLLSAVTIIRRTSRSIAELRSR